MAENKSQITDLGYFAKIFNKILKKYKIEKQAKNVLDILGEAILGKHTEIDLVNLFSDKLKLNFDQAADLAYDLKIEILDKKDKLEQVKKNLLKKLQGEFSPQLIADELLAKLPEFKIADENIKKRFLEALVSWLKDIRDLAELKEVLTRSEKIGGVGMPEPVFDKLYDLLVAKREEMQKENINIAEIIAEYEASLPKEIVVPGLEEVEETDIDVSARPAKPEKKEEKLTGEEVTIDQLLKSRGIEFKELARKEKIKQELKEKEEVKEKMLEKEAVKPELFKEIEAREEFLEGKEELAPPPPMPVGPEIKGEEAASISQKPELKESSQAKISEEKNPFADFDFKETESDLIKKTEKMPLAKPQVLPKSVPDIQPAPEIKQPIFKPAETKAGTRPRLEDVKFTPKLYGPVEELAALTVADLRRLSKDPQEAVNKLISKLELLEDESLVKKVEGIKALKTSPLYKIYADVMNQAINQGKSFEQVIEEIDQLTLAEFKAIMELNKNLKY